LDEKGGEMGGSEGAKKRSLSFVFILQVYLTDFEIELELLVVWFIGKFEVK
jgi:hypothetical protein